MIAGLTIDQLLLGQRATWKKQLTDADVHAFAGASGDVNPLHLDDSYAASTRFGRRIVHGMLVASLISTVQATKLPGPGNLYVHQDLDFLAPVFIDDTVTAVVEVAEIDVRRNRVTMRTQCINQDGTVVIDGTSILAPRPKTRSTGEE